MGEERRQSKVPILMLHCEKRSTSQLYHSNKKKYPIERVSSSRDDVMLTEKKDQETLCLVCGIKEAVRGIKFWHFNLKSKKHVMCSRCIFFYYSMRYAGKGDSAGSSCKSRAEATSAIAVKIEKFKKKDEMATSCTDNNQSLGREHVLYKKLLYNLQATTFLLCKISPVCNS